MNTKNLMQKIGGIVLAALLLFGVATMSSSAVEAQGRGGGGFHGGGFHGGGGGGFHHGGGGQHGGRGVFIGPRFGFGHYGYPYGYYGYPYYGAYGQYIFGDGTAADAQGFEDGLKTGASDERRGQSFDPERSHYYKDSGFGNFPDNYREGFERGYSQGFGR